MKIFSFLYEKMLRWARLPNAPYYLFILSFAESSFFPIPPDVMLAPMALANRERAWFYATGTTISSVLGGLFGYAIGMFCFHWVEPILARVGYLDSYHQVVQWFDAWGFWVMFIAGFSVIPYKLFTVAGGATHMALLPFIFGSLLGRGGRFYLVTALIYWGGERMEKLLEKYIDRIGWATIALLVIGVLVWRYFYV